MALWLLVSPAAAASFEFNGFGSLDVWHGDLARGGEVPLAGDFNSDGRDDVARLGPHNLTNSFDVVHDTEVFVALSEGTRFGPVSVWCTNLFSDAATVSAGDVNGDGRDDLIGFEHHRSAPESDRTDGQQRHPECPLGLCRFRRAWRIGTEAIASRAATECFTTLLT